MIFLVHVFIMLFLKATMPHPMVVLYIVGLVLLRSFEVPRLKEILQIVR